VNTESGAVMQLRICHVISGDLWAGAEVMAFHLLCALNQTPGIDIYVILLNKGKLSEELEKQGIQTFILDEKHRSFVEIAVIAIGILKKWKPHVIHSHRYKENILSYIISITLRKRAALISTQHGMPEHVGARTNILERLKSFTNFKLLSNKFHKTVAVSSDIKEMLSQNYRFQNNKLETIHNGVPVPESYKYSRTDEVFVVGSAGRFFPVKDFPFMVEVAKEVNKNTDKIRFEIAGEGPMQNDIRGLIRKYRLEKTFKLRGFVNEMENFYKKLDVYMNTSLHEGIPMSVLEAMANGIIPIASSVGGLKEIIKDGVDGYLIDVRSPQEFSEKCIALFKNRPLQREMGLAAREKIVSQFSIKRMASSYLELYKHTIRCDAELGIG
jgi:L-malate glycosyltransferase